MTGDPPRPAHPVPAEDVALDGPIDTVAPGEVLAHGGSEWTVTLRCPSCYEQHRISVPIQQAQPVTLSSRFRCTVCGYQSRLQGGEHDPLPTWKDRPSQARWRRVAEANLQHVEDRRPDAVPSQARSHLPDVPDQANPPGDSGQGQSP